jgi:hypothetical protein
MSRRLLLPLALAFAIMTPVLAQTTPPTEAEIKDIQDRVAYLKAQNDILTQQNALATNRFAPLQSFAGTGQNSVENGAGQMEAAYLAAVSMGDVAAAIDRRISAYVRLHPAPPEPVDQEAGRGFNSVMTLEQLEALRRVGTDENRDAVEVPDDEATPLGEDEGTQAAGADGNLRPAAPAPAPAEIVLLTNTEPLSFDAHAAFSTEAEGIIHASVRALRETGARCRPPAIEGTSNGNNNFILGPATVATIGALVGLLQSDTHVYGFTQLGDDAMLVSALIARRENFYIRQDELISAMPDPGDPIRRRLTEIAVCEARLQAMLPSFSGKDAPDEQKARAAELTRMLTRIDTFNSRLTTPASDGKILLGAILRQSVLRSTSSPYVLRVRVDRAGGTLITRKNLFTALGAPAIALSGGVIASYSLSNRRTGRILVGGTVICRTGLTGLRSAISLRHSEISCAENPPRDTTANAPRGRRGRPARLDYDDSVFRLTDAAASGEVRDEE